MTPTAFERLVEKDMEQCVTALLATQTTDPAVARLQARHAGLGQSLAHFRKSQRLDDDEAA